MHSINSSPVPHLQNVVEFDKFLEFYYIPEAYKSVVEIGSFFGATLWAWIKNNPHLERIMCIDLPIPKDDHRYNEMIKSRSKWHEWSTGIALHDVQRDSHDESTVRTAHYVMGTGEVDMLFIDGDHSYEGVKQDWENYKDLVKRGGLVVFHDSTGYDSVKRLCDEIRNNNQYVTDEIYEPGGWGLFVVGM